MPDKEDKIIVGRFGTAFGIKGLIKVISFTHPLENILNYRPWWIAHKNGWEKIIPEAGQLHGQQVLIKLPGCDDRNTALTYTNKEIAIDSAQLPKLSNNEYYWEDLVGLLVINKNDEDLGIVDHLLPTGANDVLVVIKEKKQRLIPFIKNVIVAVDLEKKQILVDWDSDF